MYIFLFLSFFFLVSVWFLENSAFRENSDVEFLHVDLGISSDWRSCKSFDPAGGELLTAVALALWRRLCLVPSFVSSSENLSRLPTGTEDLEWHSASCPSGREKTAPLVGKPLSPYVRDLDLIWWWCKGKISLECTTPIYCASLVAQMVKNLPAVQETWIGSLGREDPLGKGMATHSRILVWRIPWTEGPDGLQSMGSQRTRHNLAANTQTVFVLFRCLQWWWVFCVCGFFSFFFFGSITLVRWNTFLRL